jgi:D-3-phosphoglycerate dehydrogenase
VTCRSQEEFLTALGAKPYDAVFVRLGVAVDQRALAAASSLRFVVTPTTGLDHIDLAACAQRSIQVLSLRGETQFLETIRSTAEHTFALLLALVRRIPALCDEVSRGEWKRGEPGRLGELEGATLGVLGYGRLGRMVASYGKAFGMSVVAHDNAPARVELAAADEVAFATPEAVFERADVLSLHLPLVAETSGYVTREHLARMRRGAMLINTARGELIDEAALLDALERGQLGGVALDVLAGDGRWDGRVRDDHPLVQYARGHDNALITPHVGGFGKSSLERARRFITLKFNSTLRPDPSP